MAQFRTPVVTNKGVELIATTLSRKKTLIFTGCKTGSGIYAGTEDLKKSTEMKKLEDSFEIINVRKSNPDTLIVSAVVDNAKNVTGYNMTEYGIYAKVETDEEILLAIATAQVADYIPTKNISPLSILVDMYIKLQQISDIKFEYSIPSGFYTPLSLFNEKNKELERTVDGIISTVTSIKHCTLTVSGWIAHSNLFKQEVQVDKMLSDYSPILIKTLSGRESPNDVKTYCKAFNLIFAGETAAGKVIFYAYKKPERDITVGLKGV